MTKPRKKRARRPLHVKHDHAGEGGTWKVETMLIRLTPNASMASISCMTNSKPIVRWGKTHASILCPLGHQIATCDNRNLAGSRFGAEATAAQRGEPNIWDDAARMCDGFGHAEVA